MAENIIGLKSVRELLELNFFIPDYQRGYRWTSQQVEDLLSDINDFMPEDNDWYCLQPLVVKKREEDTSRKIQDEAKTLKDVENLLKGSWEVIDGQQRLTTIYIILRVLGDSDGEYCLNYETRSNSVEFLNRVKADGQEMEDSNENIDYFHINQTKRVVEQWLKDNESVKELFLVKLLNKVKFIWYETTEDDPIKVFTRLNVGKIPLTNSELIKALFLNRSNFIKNDANFTRVRLQQQEIASQWDDIEYTLQNDEFWLFIHDTSWTNPTRIDFIFDLICQKDTLEIGKDHLGTDKYRTFRYFYKYFQEYKDKRDLAETWKQVKNVFNTFKEWYNDSELYHYVGYLIEQGVRLSDLHSDWLESNQTKNGFIDNIKKRIKTKIEGCNNLDNQYEIEENPPKTACKPLLLLHNIQTVINQNKTQKHGYDGLSIFYKFPYHLYKIEHWDVEHIDSNTENSLSGKEEQNEYLLNMFNAVTAKQQEIIAKFINDPDASNWEELKGFVPESSGEKLNEAEKNQIWNFALLDSSTNRSYGNSIFAAKRRIIIGKDKGKLIAIPKISTKDKKPCLIPGEEKDAKSSFIPPCTKQVFLKYYSGVSASSNYWDKTDAEAYRQDIADVLKEFGVNITKEKDNGK